ncbi:alkaline phosphatase [Fretibacter rubidus]|uniref:alkaline phosphatase n=1 Tax=Fretibacter rubidus TaxID=570162 RepID=UPI00352A0E80
MRLLFGLLAATALTACTQATVNSTEITEPVKAAVVPAAITSNASASTWYNTGASDIAAANAAMASINTKRGSAKNIILFVGDGMGVSTVSAARIRDGQIKGGQGEENQLSFDKFPFTGLSKTYNVDAQTPDSAGTMTAMMTGVKTNIGVIGISRPETRNDCAAAKAVEIPSALQHAELMGKMTGIISTARITHATPAATYAHSANRGWEDISDMPKAAIEAGCIDIAAQFVNLPDRLKAADASYDDIGIDVAFGGGRRHFLPKDAAFNSSDADSDIEGDRTDGRDLTKEWVEKTGGQYVMDQAGFDTITTTPVLGLFSESHMRYDSDRSKDNRGEPSLAQMTAKAIDLLDDNENGFFLMVEAGRIDHGHHAGNAYNALQDTISLSEAVDAARQATSDKDTLIIVTADHSHVMTFAGYPKRGNPILGPVVGVGKDTPNLADDGKPYTTLSYANGRGFGDLGDSTDADALYDVDINAGRQLTLDVDTTKPGFRQEALVPLNSETHGGEDVAIYASGPGAHLVSGVHEQNVIFHIMNHAGGLTGE